MGDEKNMKKLNFIDAGQIMAVVVSLILLVIALFVVGTIFTAQTNVGSGPAYTADFPVTDPTVNISLGTTQARMTGVAVQEFDGITWNTVSATFWTYTSSNGTVIVESGGMTG